MKKYNVVITRTDEYEIEVDENVWNDAELADWSRVFYKVTSQRDIADDLAGRIMSQGHEGFIEGYGHVKVFYKSGNQAHPYHEGYCKGISVKLISEDENYESEVKEIK